MTLEDKRLLKLNAVLSVTSISKTTLYELIRAGEFPQPLRITPQASRWRADEIDAWIESRERGTNETG